MLAPRQPGEPAPHGPGLPGGTDEAAASRSFPRAGLLPSYPGWLGSLLAAVLLRLSLTPHLRVL